jgi:hypothetical protein
MTHAQILRSRTSLLARRNSDQMNMAPLDIHRWLSSPPTKRPPQALSRRVGRFSTEGGLAQAVAELNVAALGTPLDQSVRPLTPPSFTFGAVTQRNTKREISWQYKYGVVVEGDQPSPVFAYNRASATPDWV